MVTLENTINKATLPFEHMYIYMAGFNTVKDGPLLALFVMDEYSQYALPPVMEHTPTTDNGLQIVIEKLFAAIFKEYKPNIHPDSVTFITNLPEEIEPLIKDILPDKHLIIFDQSKTEKALQPLLAGLKF